MILDLYFSSYFICLIPILTPSFQLLIFPYNQFAIKWAEFHSETLNGISVDHEAIWGVHYDSFRALCAACVGLVYRQLVGSTLAYNPLFDVSPDYFRVCGGDSGVFPHTQEVWRWDLN